MAYSEISFEIGPVLSGEGTAVTRLTIFDCKMWLRDGSGSEVFSSEEGEDGSGTVIPTMAHLDDGVYRVNYTPTSEGRWTGLISNTDYALYATFGHDVVSTASSTSIPGTILGTLASPELLADYDIRTFVEIQACVTLLERRYFEILEEEGRNIRLGDFQYQRQVGVLGEIRQTLTRYRQMADELAVVLYGRAKPVMGIPGYR